MAKFEMPVKARRSAIKFSERASVMQRFSLLLSLSLNMSCHRENGEVYLAVKVVDQEVNRLDRVRSDHFSFHNFFHQRSDHFLSVFAFVLCI